MVLTKETKQDILVTLLIVAIIGTIAGTILYVQSLEKQVPPVIVEPNPDENQTNPDNNNNTTNPDTNTTDPDNNVTEPDVDYFEQVCNIKPTAEVCIKPINSTNSTTTTTAN